MTLLHTLVQVVSHGMSVIGTNSAPQILHFVRAGRHNLDIHPLIRIPQLMIYRYTCQSANENFNIKICCSSGTFVPVCPINARPLIIGTQYQYCTSNSGICQVGYSCVSAQNNPSIRVCCSTAAYGTFVCPNNASPYLVGSNVQLCTNNQGLCVSGYLFKMHIYKQRSQCMRFSYTCQTAVNDPTTSICCSSSSGTTSYTCPNNAIPYLIGNQYRICSSSPYVCSSGYY